MKQIPPSTSTDRASIARQLHQMDHGDGPDWRFQQAKELVPDDRQLDCDLFPDPLDHQRGDDHVDKADDRLPCCRPSCRLAVTYPV